MKKIKFKQIDVFTEKPFFGNPAAVIYLEKDIVDVKKQKVANELNLSETIFISESVTDADFKLEYFTPISKIDIAGHPTIAACYFLALEGRCPLDKEKATLRFETKAGIVPCELDIRDAKVQYVMMNQPNPTFKRFDDIGYLLSVLRLQEKDLIADYPVEFASTGLESLIVPIADLNVVQRLSPTYMQMPWNVMIFSNEALSPLAAAHTRFFAPRLGIIEDPATGIASGALTGYLVKHKIIKGESPVSFVIEQGTEVGRPSEINVEVSFDNREIKDVYVGGKAVLVADGTIYLEEE